MGGGEQGIKLLCGTWREALNGNSQERRASEGEALRRAVQPQAARVAGQFESAIDETQETLQSVELGIYVLVLFTSRPILSRLSRRDAGS